MGYEKVGPWVPGGAPPISAENLDQIETQYDEAIITSQAQVDAHKVITTGIHGVGASTIDSVAARNAAIAAVLPTIVRKDADQIVNNSTVLVNDLKLKFAVAANEVWEFLLLIRFTSSADADFKASIVGPTGAVFSLVSNQLVGGATRMFAQPTLYPLADGAGAGVTGIAVHGVIINSTTAGNLQVQWAQATKEVSDTIVLANSCIIAHKLA